MSLKINNNWNQQAVLSPELSEMEVKILIVNGALKHPQIKRAIKENYAWVIKGPHKDHHNNDVISIWLEDSDPQKNCLLNLHIKKKTFDKGESWVFNNKIEKTNPPENIILEEKPGETDDSWTQLLRLKNKLNSQ